MIAHIAMQFLLGNALILIGIGLTFQTLHQKVGKEAMLHVRPGTGDLAATGG